MEKLVYYIANTYINCKGEANVSFYCSENNISGAYLSEDFRNSSIVLYDVEDEALKKARYLGPEYSVHSTWMELEAIK